MENDDYIQGVGDEHVPWAPVDDTHAFRYIPQAEGSQFQEGEHGIPTYFSAIAEVSGLVLDKSKLMIKKNGSISGGDTCFLSVTLDVGPLYRASADRNKSRLRNVMVCYFFDARAVKVDRALTDINSMVYTQPWMTVRGHIENRFEWVDKKIPSKGKRRTGGIIIRGIHHMLPPIPKSRMFKEGKRAEDFPDAPIIRV